MYRFPLRISHLEFYIYRTIWNWITASIEVAYKYIYLYSYSTVLYKYYDKFYHNSFITLQNLLKTIQYTCIHFGPKTLGYKSFRYVYICTTSMGRFWDKGRKSTFHNAVFELEASIFFYYYYFTPYLVVHCWNNAVSLTFSSSL